MKKYYILLILAIISGLGTSWAAKKSKEKAPERYPIMYAHRGGWVSRVIPENSTAAVAMAARFGYTGIELDVRYTADSVMVVLHDRTLNRTARRTNGYTKLTEPVKLSSLTFEELRRDYVLASRDTKLRTQIPTLKEILTACKEHGMIPMLHSSIPESYRMAQEMFGDNWICFTSSLKCILNVRKYSNCLVLWAINKGTPEEVIAQLKRIGGRCGISTMKSSLLTEEFCKALTSARYEVQASIFKTPREEVAQYNGITYQLTDFSFMPLANKKPQETWTIQKKKLGKEKLLTKHWENPIECGGIVVKLDFKGMIKVILNGKRTYTISSDGRKPHYIGTRFTKQVPKVHIEALTGSKINLAEASVYSL